jgi:hypothetical protein
LLQIREDTAAGYLPQADTAEELAARFDATYSDIKVRRAA